MSNNKRYYWMKLFDSFFQDPKIKKLKRMPGGDTYIVIMLKMMLQTIKTNGLYEFEQLESSLAAELELKLDEDEKAIQVVLDYMNGYGMILQVETNQYMIPQVQKMIGTETASTQRSRKSREKKQKMLQCNTPATKSNTELELKLEKELEIDETTTILNRERAAQWFTLSGFQLAEFKNEFERFKIMNEESKRTFKNWKLWVLQLKKFNKQQGA